MNSEEQRDFLNRIARALDEGLNGDKRPKPVGFALLLYNFDQVSGGRVNYIGNGRREDMHVALKELLARWEGQKHEEGHA